MTATPRPDASMSLITELMERPLEPSYAAAAHRRVDAGLPPATSTRSVTVVVMAVIVGFALAIAALSLRSTSSVVGRARAQLIDQINGRQGVGDQLAGRIQALETEIAAIRASALAPSGQSALLAELKRLQVAAGSVPVTGPGLLVSLDDAAAPNGSNADPRANSGFGDGRVTATDLQVVTNGLWAAGAEAISINGQRLTTHSAIRFAGQAILVDFRALARPYVVTAIGDTTAMQGAFGASTVGSYVKALTDNYGIPVTIEGSGSLTCPASSVPVLRYAEPLAPGASAPATSVPTSTAKPSPTSGTKKTTGTTSKTTTATPKTSTGPAPSGGPARAGAIGP